MPGVSRTKVIRWTALLACAAAIALSSVAHAQQPAVHKRVLVLYWYNKDYPWNVSFDRVFQAGLRSARPKTIEYFPEYLETNRFPGEKQSRLLHDYLKQKYADRPIDVVVANSDKSLEFLLNYRADLFPNATIVFIATRRPAPAQLATAGAITGMLNLSGYQKTVDLALRLHPETRHVYVISGTLEKDDKFEAAAREQLRELESRVAITYLTDLPVHELIARAKTLPEHSVVLYVWQQSQDAAGSILETQDVFASIVPPTRVPIYTLTPMLIRNGAGAVGGYVDTADDMGTRAAALALRIANGARAQDIPVERVPGIPTFDWRQLKRWGIGEERLPADAVVLFREPTFWQLYKWRIVGAVSLFLLQAVLIAFLLVERRRRRLAMAALDERLRFERLLFELSTELGRLQTNEIRVCIATWIGRFGELFHLEDGAFVDLPKSEVASQRAQTEARLPGLDPRQWVEFLGRIESGSIVTLPLTPPQAGAPPRFLFAVPVSADAYVRALVYSTTDPRRIESPDLAMRMRVVGEIFSETLTRRHQENELRTSEERFETAFRSNPQPMSLATLSDGRYLDVNDSFLEISGYSREEIAGRTPAELDFWPDPADQDAFLERLTTQRRVRDFEMKFRTRSGALRDFLASAELLDLGGEQCVLVAASDITERKKLENDLMRLTGRLFHLQDEERRRIARELHDETAQNLFGISVNLARLRRPGATWLPDQKQILDDCVALVDLSIRGIRTLSYLLHPPLLDEAGLVSAVQWYVEGFVKRSEIQVELFVQEIGRLDSEVETALFRIVQEGLTNINKHSGGARASIRLESNDGQVILEIRDDGRGMATSTSSELPEGIDDMGVGIPGMRQRMRQLGGTLEVVSSDRGTMVTATVPMTLEAAAVSLTR